MNGLIIWAYSNCRSTMALYRSVQRLSDCPVKIVLSKAEKGCVIPDIRKKVGFREDEFKDVDVISLNNDYLLGIRIMDESPNYTHLFCAYQSEPIYRKLIQEAKRRNERIFIAGEAPCNMSSGWRWWLKEIYLRFVLRWKVRRVVNAAEKFICFSGDAFKLSALAGWHKKKVVPFGYFPPPIEKSKCVKRTNNEPFVILTTGILSKYRGADVLVKALKLLKDRGINYRAIITQEGELLPELKKLAAKHNLPIEFPGFLPMDELIRLYENCSVYVGSGKSEPWGMRLNDALNCGAPLVISCGMGGVKFVDDYKCGLSYSNNNAKDLADQLQRLAENKDLFLSVATKAYQAQEKISPEFKAQELLDVIRRR